MGELHDTEEHEIQNLTENPSEQRNESKDRRVIKRFSDKRVYGHLKQISLWIKILMGLLLGWGIYIININFNKGMAGLGEGFFWNAFILFLLIPLFRYNTSINFYLTNESVNNLEKCIESQTTLFMILTSMAILFTIVLNL